MFTKLFLSFKKCCDSMEKYGSLMVGAGSPVAVDSKDNVYCFNRGNMPVLVFDPKGNLIRYWGNSTPFAGTRSYVNPYGSKVARWCGTEFARPHAIEIDHEDNVWLLRVSGAASSCFAHSAPRNSRTDPGGQVRRRCV